ncbi:MAG: radical SAM protein [Endomicrobiales bacterium]|nr:radical SAM protein [Endomicrobiales bacterium]
MSENQNKFFLCYFESTRKCNLNCPYCMTRIGDKPEGEELSTNEVKRLVIDEVCSYCSHPAMAFSGGEFLLRNDAVEILRYTAEKRMWSFINTNGTKLNKKMLLKIKKATGNKVIFVFSLNSLEPKINKWSRNDSLNTVVKVVKLCAKEGVNFFFIATISKNNLDTLKKTVEFIKSKGIPVLRSPFVPRGAGKNYTELLFSPKDMESVIYPILRDYHLSYVSYTPFFAGPEFLEEKRKQLNVNLGQFGCQAAKGFVGINAEGDVAPCVQLLDSNVKCGNIRKTPLLDILRSNDVLLKLRERKEIKGKCGICRYKHTCGGCRAMAYYKTGDYMESDPNCFFEPEDENTVSENENLQNENADRFINFISKHEPWKSLFNPENEAISDLNKLAMPHQHIARKMKKYIKSAVGMLTNR